MRAIVQSACINILAILVRVQKREQASEGVQCTTLPHLLDKSKRGVTLCQHVSITPKVSHWCRAGSWHSRRVSCRNHSVLVAKIIFNNLNARVLNLRQTTAKPLGQ